MARIVTIADNRNTRGQKVAVKVVAPRINKTYRGTVEDWVLSGAWVKVKSSNVREIAYDKATKRLWALFKRSDQQYFYEPVSTRQAKDFYGCPSMGKFTP